MAEEYDVEKIVDQVIVSHSPEVDYIDKALSYHGSLWLHKYTQYQEFLFQLGKFGNPLDYSSKKEEEREGGRRRKEEEGRKKEGGGRREEEKGGGGRRKKRRRKEVGERKGEGKREERGK